MQIRLWVWSSLSHKTIFLPLRYLHFTPPRARKIVWSHSLARGGGEVKKFLKSTPIIKVGVRMPQNRGSYAIKVCQSPFILQKGKGWLCHTTLHFLWHLSGAYFFQGKNSRATTKGQNRFRIFSSFSHFSALFQNFSPRTFPFKTKGFSSRRTKDKKR